MINRMTPKAQNQELFCQKYWRKMKNKALLSKIGRQEPHLFDYHDCNYNILNINTSKTTDNKSLGNLDLAFKFFEPSKEKYTTWRGVTNPLYYKKDLTQLNNYFEKCKNIKLGEILYMNEFPYVSMDYKYAMAYISNAAKDYEHILFEIEIPEGTCFLNDICRNVLQRCSKFLCTGTEKVQDGEKTFQHIKLTLLPRDVQYNNEVKEDESFLQRVLNKLKNIFK